ncbi:unnamed protein product [Protopolystoma xenopodis]|uniref:Uncharacterized protein n=1 Tax=Protopolystoma xenopodis TaxID=117903 RepID=A0A3S5ASH3_9PLAT|nr:unnamed protein product [Protopolystoma xenopodis]
MIFKVLIFLSSPHFFLSPNNQSVLDSDVPHLAPVPLSSATVGRESLDFLGFAGEPNCAGNESAYVDFNTWDDGLLCLSEEHVAILMKLAEPWMTNPKHSPG